MQVSLKPSWVPGPMGSRDKGSLTNEEAGRVWLMLSDVVVKEERMKEMEFDVMKKDGGLVVASGKIMVV